MIFREQTVQNKSENCSLGLIKKVWTIVLWFLFTSLSLTVLFQSAIVHTHITCHEEVRPIAWTMTIVYEFLRTHACHLIDDFIHTWDD